MLGDGELTVFVRSGRGEWAPVGSLEPVVRGVAGSVGIDPDLLLAAALALNVRPTPAALGSDGEFVDGLETPALMANIGLH